MSKVPPDYKKNDPKGWCGDPKRGAAMGRGTIQEEDGEHYTAEIYVQRVELDDGGYDQNGTYFGIGMPLYWISNKNLTIDYVIRAPSRSWAVQDALHRWPHACFPVQPKDKRRVKDQTIKLRLSALDKKRVEELAEHAEVSLSAMLRRIIKEKYKLFKQAEAAAQFNSLSRDKKAGG